MVQVKCVLSAVMLCMLEVDTTDSDLQPVVIVLLLLGIKTVIFVLLNIGQEISVAVW